MKKVNLQALSMRVEVQDDQLAQVKEDNIVLRSQVIKNPSDKNPIFWGQ